MHSDPKNFFPAFFNDINTTLSSLDLDEIIKASDLILKTSAAGGKVVFVGNGGSAAMASHVSVDMTKAARVRSINFNEADLLTCFSNDYGYENWVKEALRAFADPGDTLVLISSSGRSPNIINGATAARDVGMSIITFSGFDEQNPLRLLGDINFYCKSDSYNIIELTHQTWLLSLVDFIKYHRKSET